MHATFYPPSLRSFGVPQKRAVISATKAPSLRRHGNVPGNCSTVGAYCQVRALERRIDET